MRMPRRLTWISVPSDLIAVNCVFNSPRKGQKADFPDQITELQKTHCESGLEKFFDKEPNRK